MLPQDTGTGCKKSRVAPMIDLASCMVAVRTAALVTVALELLGHFRRTAAHTASTPGLCQTVFSICFIALIVASRGKAAPTAS